MLRILKREAPIVFDDFAIDDERRMATLVPIRREEPALSS
jgi:hypothetical protein